MYRSRYSEGVDHLCGLQTVHIIAEMQYETNALKPALQSTTSANPPQIRFKTKRIISLGMQPAVSNQVAKPATSLFD